MDIENLYDKIYRYCYFRLHSRELAEDITQETFLRYFQKYNGSNFQQPLKYLYTIARNLCIDEYRRPKTEHFEEAINRTSNEEDIITRLDVKGALKKLEVEEQELLLLRYVNEVQVSVIAQILGISRFAVYRKLLSVSKKFKKEIGKEDLYEKTMERRPKTGF